MAHAPDILQKILRTKAEEIATQQQACSLAQLKTQCEMLPPTRGFIAALKASVAASRPAVIAEIKKASPSKGIIRESFDPTAIAQSYAKHGASCLSVLTDEHYFQGHRDYLVAAHQACDLPILRKDFMIEPYQVYEARAMQADCILLIVAALSEAQLQALYQLATELGLDVLLEVHNAEELQIALNLKPDIIGINNRNLRTFETHLSTTLDLLPQIPDSCLVLTESGILKQEDVALMQAHQVNGFLVGEAFMRAEEPGQALADLFFR
ncbi:MAG: indole-3-glycerol phosphate synthase TrpC [bacterium]